jgi:hypothetical protein
MKKHISFGRGCATLLLGVGLLAGSGVVSAQGVMNATDENQLLISSIQTDKRAIVLRSLNLDDAQARAFAPIYDDYQRERKKLYERSIDLLDEFTADQDPMTDAKAAGVLKEWLALRQSNENLLRKYTTKMGKVLPSVKVLRFAQIEHRLNTLLDLQASRVVPLAN